MSAPAAALAQSPPSLADIADLRARFGDRILVTPVWPWRTDLIRRLLPDTDVTLKLELFQHTGSFKPRGALANMLDLDAAALGRGVTAITAGNHGVGVAYAARALGTSARIVISKTVNAARLARVRSYGAEVILVDDMPAGWALVREIEQREGRTFVHPFEGERTARGTATVGAELMEQAPDLDAVIVPVGGGGLLAGIASAVKQIAPGCAVYGVEPSGADTMYRSFASGRPESLGKMQTIADSLGAPHAAPYSFALCRRYADDIVLVDDDALCHGMALLFHEGKLAVEPAGAAATAALLGPLRERLRGRRVGLVVCGANIDTASYAAYLQRGDDLLRPATAAESSA